MNVVLARVCSTVVASAAVLGTQWVSAPAAQAGACDRNNFDVDSYGRYFKAGYQVGGGPGVLLTLKRNKAFTVNASLTTTAGASAKFIAAEVKAEVSFSVGASYSSSVEESASWKVPKSYERGILAAGAYKYKVKVTNDIRLPNCKLVRTETGRTRVVEKFTTYKHWKDS
jgi:hypothetical protein